MINKIYIFFLNQNHNVYKRFIFIIFVLVIAMIFEMIGLSLIIPLVTQIVSEQPNFLLISLNEIFSNLFKLEFISYIETLEFFKDTQTAYLLVTTILVLLFYTFKVSLLTFTLKMQSDFIYLIHANLSAQLFKKYLGNSYKFHLKSNSSKLLKNLISEIDQLIINGIVPIMLLITDFALVIAVTILLIFYEPLGTISAIIFILAMSIIFIKFTNKKIITISSERQKYEDEKYKEFQEALGSILEIKVYQKEKYFYNKFFKNLVELRKIASFHHFITFVPQIWLEYIALYGLFFLIVIISTFDNSPSSQIATLSLFAASLFRLLPAISRIISSYNRVKFTEVVFDLINNHLNSKDASNEKNNNYYNFNKNSLSKKKSILFRNIYFKYNNVFIFEDASFEIEFNKINGIIGESGSGKSTLVNLLLGVISPESGSIYFSHKDENSASSNWLKNFSYVPQKIYLSDDSILQNIAFGSDIENIDRIKIQEIIRKVKLKDLIMSLPNGLENKIGEKGIRISGGQSQRIGIARIMYQNREIIILDEATSALDKNTEIEVLNGLFSNIENKTFIIIAHRKETIDKCDNLFLVENKKIKKIK